MSRARRRVPLLGLVAVAVVFASGLVAACGDNATVIVLRESEAGTSADAATGTDALVNDAPVPGDASDAASNDGTADGDAHEQDAEAGTPDAEAGMLDANAPDADAAVDPEDPIFKTEAFAWADPGQAADTKDPLGTHTGQVPLEGKNCSTGTCHGTGGPKPWKIAGTVYAAQTGGATLEKAEVRVVYPDGSEYLTASTDVNGNFWGAQASAFPEGAKVGVRREGGATKVMVGTLSATTGFGCNASACHGTDTNRIFAP